MLLLPSFRTALLAALPLLTAILCLVTAPSSVTAQSVVPQVYPLTSCASATAQLVTLGNTTVLPYTYPLSTNYPQILFTAFNDTSFGATLSQLSIALGDNSGSGKPIHLRMGVYSVAPSTGATPMTLLAQTDEITLYPSGPQTMYGNLLQPAQLFSGGQYAFAIWSDSAIVTYAASVSLLGYYGYSSFYEYVDYGMPSSVTATGPAPYYTTAMAASGCLDSSPLSATGTALYYMCAYAEQFASSSSTTDQSVVASTNSTLVSGILTVSTTASATSFGTGYQVLSLTTATLTTSVNAQYYFEPSFTLKTLNLAAATATTTNKVKGVTPSNLVYTSGAAVVDTNGLTFVASTGAQYVLQWNAATQQYQFLSSTTNGAAPSPPVMYSGVTLTPVTEASQAVLSCTPQQVYTPPSVPSCPANTYPVTMGDLTDHLDPADVSGGYAYAYGNVIYFRPFSVAVSGTIVQSLSTYLLPNPGVVIHLRLGLFSLNGLIGSPAWTLLAQTGELTVANSLSETITAPLPSAMTLQTGTYAVGVWFDQSVYTYSTYWEVTPQPYNLYLQYTSLSPNGQMPSYASPKADYQLVASAAQTCVPGVTSQIVFSFCAAFPAPYGQTDVTTGLLTALATPYTNAFGSYYLVTGGNATRPTLYPPVNLYVGSLALPLVQRLYINSTTLGGVLLDTTGLQLYYAAYGSEPTALSIFAQLIPYTPAFAYAATEQLYYQPATAVNVGPGEFSYQPYTGGDLPDCEYVYPVYDNLLTPLSQPIESCSATASIKVIAGDPVLADYRNQAEGNSVPALTVYTSPFTITVGGVSVTQVAVDILANTASNLNVYLGIYSSTGALLASTPLLNWLQAYDQQVMAYLNTPVTLPAGSYYAAVVADGPLNIATSVMRSPSAAVTSLGSGLPSTISLTASSASSVPIAVYGCVPASHSLCAFVQYYSAPVNSSVTSTTYQYQGLLAVTANSDGSVTVQQADVRVTAWQRAASYISQSAVLFTEAFLAASSKLYPSGAQLLDGTGLLLTSPALNLSLSLSYSATLGQYVDSWGTANALPGTTVVTSSASVTAVGTSGIAVPACSLLTLPASLSSSPPPPVCSSGFSAVTLGDATGSDFAYNAEEIDYGSDDFLTTVAVTTGSSAVSLSQVALGVNNNFNTVARFRFAVYNTSFGLLGSTNEVTAINSADEAVIGVLTTPVVLLANTTYLLAMWYDDSLYLSFGPPSGNPCGPLTYVSGQPFPNPYTPNIDYACSTIPLAGLGCTTTSPVISGGGGTTNTSGGCSCPVANTTSGSCGGSSGISSTGGSGGGGGGGGSSTGGSAGDQAGGSGGSTGSGTTNTASSGSSNDVPLSKGAVVGILIGCVVGTNLLLLLCLFLLCGLRPDKRADFGSDFNKHPNARKEPSSRVEMASAESSQAERP